jgi:hypothetical protein
MREAIADLKRAYESMLNAASYQTAESTNLVLNLAPIVKQVSNVLEEIDTEPDEPCTCQSDGIGEACPVHGDIQLV